MTALLAFAAWRIAVIVAVGLGAGLLTRGLLWPPRARPRRMGRILLILVAGVAAVHLALPTGRPAAIVALAGAEQLDEALREATTPVVVDFYADWCPTCRVLAPVLAQAQERWAGRMKFFKVNVDDSADLADRFQVQAIPTVVYFVDGREVSRTVGTLTEGELQDVLQELSGRAAKTAGTTFPRP